MFNRVSGRRGRPSGSALHGLGIIASDVPDSKFLFYLYFYTRFFNLSNFLLDVRYLSVDRFFCCRRARNVAAGHIGTGVPYSGDHD